MIPWTSFEGFNLNLQKGYDYLLPVFTILRWESFSRKTGTARFSPMRSLCTRSMRSISRYSAKVLHAVCDRFHLYRFLNGVQELINGKSPVVDWSRAAWLRIE